MQIIEDTGRTDEFGNAIMITVGEETLTNLEHSHQGCLPGLEYIQEEAIAEFEDSEIFELRQPYTMNYEDMLVLEELHGAL